MRIPKSARHSAVWALLPLALTGCGFGGAGQHEYGVQQRTVAVDAGARFTLKVPARPFMGEHWYLASPRPDAGVIEYRGMREDIHGSPEGVAGGGDGTAYFDFTAVKKGTTTVKLLHCAMGRCADPTRPAPSTSPVPTATGSPDGTPAYYLYTVTVR
ncbi:protease inhibitor I42 family protein [Streptomyces sp. NPDC002676]